MAIIKGKSLREKLEDLMRRVESGELGYHDQQIRVSKILQDEKIPNEVIWEEFQKARDKVQRRFASDTELQNAISWKSNGINNSRPYEKPDRVVKPCQASIDTWASMGKVEDLMRSSNEIPQDPKDILRDMYEPNDYLFIHETLGLGPILTRDEWCERDLTNMQFICQSILRDPKAGRNNANVEKQKWYVFETDLMPKDWDGQAGLIIRLSQELPLKAVVASGSKSLHSFFQGNVPRKDKIKRWFELAKMLGGDNQVLDVRCQLVRFFWGLNQKTNQRQKVIFYKHG